MFDNNCILHFTILVMHENANYIYVTLNHQLNSLFFERIKIFFHLYVNVLLHIDTIFNICENFKKNPNKVINIFTQYITMTFFAGRNLPTPKF